MDKLSQVLWRERELLETLSYRLEVEQLVLAGGRTQWLARATEEVEVVLAALREAELARAVAADEAAASVGLDSAPSLRALAEAVDEPWRTILLDHRDAFEEVSRHVEQLALVNRELLAAGLRSAREALLSLELVNEGYAADGAAVVVQEDAPRLLDRAL